MRGAEPGGRRVRDARFLSRLLLALRRLRALEPARRGTAQGVRLSGSPYTARRCDGVLWRRDEGSTPGLRRDHKGHEEIAPQWLNRSGAAGPVRSAKLSTGSKGLSSMA